MNEKCRRWTDSVVRDLKGHIFNPVFQHNVGLEGISDILEGLLEIQEGVEDALSAYFNLSQEKLGIVENAILGLLKFDEACTLFYIREQLEEDVGHRDIDIAITSLKAKGSIKVVALKCVDEYETIAISLK